MSHIDPNDFSRALPTPREKLRRHIAHCKERPAPKIEAVTRTRDDVYFICGMYPPRVTISLPRVKGYFEEEGK